LGTKNCSTKTSNALPSIDPFSVINPTTFFKLIAPKTVIFEPDKMVVNRRLYYHILNVRGLVSTPIKRPFSPRKRGCAGRYFSLCPNIHTSKIALFQWQTDSCV
jgi:hypothetical protein